MSAIASSNSKVTIRVLIKIDEDNGRTMNKSKTIEKMAEIMENHERNGEINILRGINSKHNLNQPESN